MRHATGNTTDLDENELSRIPSGMDTDPTADEEVIDQRAGNEHYPKAVEEPGPARIVPDNLSDLIAYAIDGSGPGPANNG